MSTAARPAAREATRWETTTWQRLRRWRPTRRGLLISALLGLALVVLVMATPQRTGYLDPAAVDPAGSRAVVTLLRDQGVTVTDVRTSSDAVANARGAGVLVTVPGLVTAEMVGRLLAAGPARILLVSAQPGDDPMQRLAAGVEPAEPAGTEPLAPTCSLPAAERAGTAVLPGGRYDARAWGDAALGCYTSTAAASVVLLPARADRPEVLLLGSDHPLTNAGLDEEGNAALALSLLGAQDALVWWRPSPSDPALGAGGSATPADLLPPWVLPVLVQGAVASLLVVWWRSRRLGPLVIEPLPVVVRAGETTEGYARLLHSQHARGEAAAHLRSAARERLRVRLGLAPAAPAGVLVAASARRAGRSPAAVEHLLYGPEPRDDAALVALDADLRALMAEVAGA